MTEEVSTEAPAKTVTLEEALKRITELEAELAELRTATPAQAEAPKLSSYKIGDFVSIFIPTQVEKEDGRVIEEARKGQLLSVATAKGEFAIGSSERIRKQGQSW